MAAPEQIKLAEFDIGIEDLLEEAAKLKVTLRAITEAQQDMKESGDDLSANYVENEAKLKVVRSEYNKYVKMLGEVYTQTAENASRTETLAVALEHESKTIKQARDENKLLNKLRNDTNVLTEEGRAELDLLNAKLDKNNKFIKENVDQYTKQKIGIGDYAGGIREAFSEMDLFNGGIENITQNFQLMIVNIQAAGGATAFFSGVVAKATTAIKTMTVASLRFLATPFGAVLGAIGVAVLLVSNAMNRSESSTNKLSKAFSGISGVVSKFLAILEPLGVFILDVLIEGFEKLEKAVMITLRGLSIGLSKLGFDDAAKDVADFTQGLEDAAQQGRDLADAEELLTQNRRKTRLVMLEYQKDTELLRQRRDDESLSTKERIRANEQLGNLLNEQRQVELALAKQALETANLRIAKHGETTETLDAQYEALTEIADIEERITGMASEQLTQKNSLLREGAEKQSEILAKAAQAQSQQLELYLQEQGTRKKSMREELELAEEVKNRKIEIAKAEFEATKKTENDKLALKIAMNNAEEELAQARTEIAIENAEREYDVFKNNLDRRLNNHGKFNEKWLEQEQDRIQKTLQAETKLAEQRKEQGIINEQQLIDAIEEYKENAKAEKAAVELEAMEAKRDEELEIRIANFEAEQILLEEENASALELERNRFNENAALKLQDLDFQLANELISQENFDAQSRRLEVETSQFKKKIFEQEQAAKLGSLKASFDVASDIIGKNSVIGKGIAVASALINTYQGISAGVKLGYPAAIPAVAAAAATGFKAVKEIVKTKIPNVSGGSGSGSQASATTGFGESVANFSGSGVNLSAVAASGNAAVQQDVQRSSGISNLSEDVSRGVREGSRQGTREGSQRGITEAASNREVQNSSTF